MKRILVVLLMLFMLTIPALAQDATEAVNAPVATQEAPVNTGTNEQPSQPSVSFADLVLLVSNVIAYIIILAQAVMQNGSVNRKTLDSLFSGLKGLARIIPGDADDKLVGAIESGVDAFVGQGIAPESKVTIETKPAGSAAG